MKPAEAEPVRGLHSLKVQSRHLDRSAVVYVRQSSLQQVLHHQESTRRQYGLQDVAVTLGWADLQARQNVVAARLTATVKPTPKLLVRADLHRFWRAEESDAVYAASGAVLRAPGGNSESYVATELDLQAKYTIDRHWEVEAGYAHVWSGDFIQEAGPSENTDFWYVQVTFTF